MERNCSLCGNIYHNTVFKGGYVCEDCLQFIRTANLSELSPVDTNNN
jgi:hypothetical protein